MRYSCQGGSQRTKGGVIDGVPVIDNAAPRELRPGLHAIVVAAPGHRGHAAIIEVRSGEAIQIALAPAPGDAVERLGAAWAAGAADVGTESGRRAIAPGRRGRARDRGGTRCWSPSAGRPQRPRWP